MQLSASVPPAIATQGSPRTRAGPPRRSRAPGRVHAARRDADRAVRVEDAARTAAGRVMAAVLAATITAGSVAPAAEAVLNSPNARIARRVDVALRRSTPAFNERVKEAQDILEELAFLLRIPQRKPWSDMYKNILAAAKLAADTPAMLYGVPTDNKSVELANKYLADAVDCIDRAASAIQAKSPDQTSRYVQAALSNIAQLELLQAPGLPFQVPVKYRQYPILTGRAVVEMTLKRSPRNADLPFTNYATGARSDTASVEITVDGYSAPVSGGAFVSAVLDKKWEGQTLEIPPGPSVFVGKDMGNRIPLEILPIGGFEPEYGSPLEVADGELPVLPLSNFGAVAMSRPFNAEQSEVSSDQFFIYLFDQGQAGLSGLSFDEGQFGVLGYVTGGDGDPESLMKQVQPGDEIISMKIISGRDRLFRPQKAEDQVG